MSATLESPLLAFTLLLLVILVIPPIFERLRLPGLVGLLVAGIGLGSHGLGLLDHDSETMALLSDIGKIYLMFVAGLEIDLAEFRKTRDRSLLFGVLTFLFPMVAGTGIGLLFGMGPNAAILIGSLLASHTLLGYPIINRLGVGRTEAVAVTVGATIFTDIAALLVLAICVAVHAGEFSWVSLLLQLGGLALYSSIVLVGFDWAGKAYFRRTGDEESNQFLFILLAVFVAAVGAQLINIDKIVGAFLVGLAVNDVLDHSPVEEKVVFVGSTLFIPFFFVDIGLLLDVPGLVASVSQDGWLSLAMVGGLVGSKFLAAWLTQWRFHYSWTEMATMWSLTLPQVAATLAAALAGVQAGLLPVPVFNAVIILMLTTSILGPVLTARFARELPRSASPANGDEGWGGDVCWIEPAVELPLDEVQPFTVMIPVHNPQTQRFLIELGSLLAQHEQGRILTLAIAPSHIHLSESEVAAALQQSRRLLARSLEISQEFGVNAIPLVRMDADAAQGISHAAREQNADLVVMGWSPGTGGIQARLFGTLIDRVFWSSHCPVTVVKLLDSPRALRRILVPIKAMTPQALRPVRLALFLAEMNQGSVTLLYVCDRQTDLASIDQFESALKHGISTFQSTVEVAIQTRRSNQIADIIIEMSQSFDLVILRSMRRRTAGGLAVSDVTTGVIGTVACSMILYGEPSSH